MISFIQSLGVSLIKFLVNMVCKITLFATLISVAVCLVLFFMCFFTGHPVYALLSLLGMLSFLYTNKQF